MSEYIDKKVISLNFNGGSDKVAAGNQSRVETFPYVSIFLLILLISVFAICGCDGEEAVGSPEDIVEKAIAAQGELKSVQLEMISDMELKSPGDSRTVSTSYKGLFERPNKWKMVIQSAGMKSEVVIIGQEAYVKEPGSDTWLRRKSDVLGTSSSSEDVVDLEYMSSASDVRLVDRKDDRYHLQFNLDVVSNAALFNVSGISEADKSLLAGKKANMEIWVLKDRLYIEKAILSFNSNPTGEEVGGIRVSIETRFSGFNEPVSIEPPS
ncbi:MAG: hypothetical protein JW738_07055 [Actinobacteria bacterium]|nr:hypothetical protein [Actinomycetota bacterium]